MNQRGFNIAEWPAMEFCRGYDRTYESNYLPNIHRRSISNTQTFHFPVVLWKFFFKGIIDVKMGEDLKIDGYTVIIETYGPNNRNPKNEKIFEKMERMNNKFCPITVKDVYGNTLRVMI